MTMTKVTPKLQANRTLGLARNVKSAARSY
jgi:hypothetical protein